MSALAIEAAGLGKRFGATRALDGLDLAVPAGVVYGLLGPNGAGKSTAVRILATLLAPDDGTAQVLGRGVVREGRAVRRRIALAGQSATVDGATVLLTTQYLDEADKLAARVAVIHGGRLAAEGTPGELKEALGASSLDEAFLALTAAPPETETTP